MKKTWLLQALLLLLPLTAALLIRGDLEALFDDRRAVFQAERLEEIEGLSAGSRAERLEINATRKYIVKKGDTWWGIARSHGIRDRNALERHNGGIELRPGIEISIPGELVAEP